MNHTPEYINSPSTTPYTWEVADENGIILYSEFDHVGNVTPLSAVFARTDAQKVVNTLPNGEEIKDNVTQFTAERALVFKIKPLRGNLPEMEFDFTPGMRLVFDRDTFQSVGVSGSGELMPATAQQYETLIFGRVHPEGLEQCAKIWPTGEVRQFSKIAEAKQFK